MMRIVTREALTARPLPVAVVPDAFGQRGGCYVRGYTDAELDLMLGAATSGGKLDPRRLSQVQLAQVLLTGPAPDSPRLLGPEPAPTREQIAQVAAFPPAAFDRLVQISDNLVGLTVELNLAVQRGSTFLDEPEPDPDAPLRLAEVADLASHDLVRHLVDDACGELGGLWVSEYTVDQKERWEQLARRGREVHPRRARWAKLAGCLYLGPDADSPRLVGSHDQVTAEDLVWLGRYLWPGEQLRLDRIADVLSGWSADTEARLATAEIPLPGASLASGASTG